MTAPDLSAAELAEQLAKVEQRITVIQEQADQGGMFQHVSTAWHKRYMLALRELAKVRTQRDMLALRLDIARRNEEEVRAHNAYREQLGREIAEAGAIG